MAAPPPPEEAEEAAALGDVDVDVFPPGGAAAAACMDMWQVSKRAF